MGRISKTDLNLKRAPVFYIVTKLSFIYNFFNEFELP